MPIDPSIALQFRGPQIESPVAQYGNVLAIQNAQNQNRLADLQFRQATRVEEDSNALRQGLAGADLSTPEGLRTAQNALLRIGKPKEAQELGAAALNQRNIQSQIDERTAQRYRANLGIVGSALAPLAQNPSRQAVEGTLAAWRAQGIEAPPIPLPADDALLPQWVRQAAAMTEQGLKALNAFSPNVSMQDVAGANGAPVVAPFNTNPLAGPLGQIPGAPVTPKAVQFRDRDRGGYIEEVNPYTGATGGRLAKTMSPGEAAADRRAREALQSSKAPVGYRFKADGLSLEAIPGGPAEKDKALTEVQGGATAFGMRAAEANALLNTLEDSGTLGKVANVLQGPADAVGALPILGKAVAPVFGAAGNMLTSAPQQNYSQAKQNFISAVLRKESGAVISDQEFAREDRKYFPQIGDSAAVVEQKRKARETAVEALRVQAGPGAAKIPKASKQPQRPSNVAEAVWNAMTPEEKALWQ